MWIFTTGTECVTMLAATVGLLVTSTLAQAADPATACKVAKFKAVGKKAACLATEEAKAMLGERPNPAKCKHAFTTAFANAEAVAAREFGACTVTRDVAVIERRVDTCLDDIAAALGGSPPAPCTHFPATGQTTAFQANKHDDRAEAVDVPDDGTVRAGATLSYTDNNDGTITDNNTGLIWEKKTNADRNENFTDLHDADNLFFWSGNGSQETIWDWLEDINDEGGTGFAGHSDWRIPNVRELQSIVDYGRNNPSINPIFGPTLTANYWSSTTQFGNFGVAWVVTFNAGLVPLGSKTGHFGVRAVRGGR